MLKSKSHFQTSIQAKVIVTIIGILFAFVVLEIGSRIINQFILSPEQGLTQTRLVDQFDDVLGWTRLPYSEFLSKSNKSTITRTANRYGFYDLDRDSEKDMTVQRIGFFGDSFTEAVQVSLPKTFVRQSEELVNAVNGTLKVETMGFGISGYSGLQSMLNIERQLEGVELDTIVYVFYENDLGDHLSQMTLSNREPFATLSPDKKELVIDNGFLANRFETKIQSNFVDDSNFLNPLIHLSSYKLLRKLWVSKGKIIAKTTSMTNPNDPVSLWSEEDRNEGREIQRLILQRMSRVVSEKGKEFVVLLIPNKRFFHGDLPPEDSWFPVMHNLCEELDLECIDPREVFTEFGQLGEIYEGHFTELGHYAFSNAFVDWYYQKHFVN